MNIHESKHLSQEFYKAPKANIIAINFTAAILSGSNPGAGEIEIPGNEDGPVD